MVGDRSCLSLLRRFFLFNRRFLAAADIRVFFLNLIGLSASCSNSTKRSTAASRLAAWLRWRWETTLNMPSLLTLVLNRVMIRFLFSAERLGELATSNSSVTRLLILLTFWPPGLLLREKVKDNSSSPIRIPFLIWTMCLIPGRSRFILLGDQSVLGQIFMNFLWGKIDHVL